MVTNTLNFLILNFLQQFSHLVDAFDRCIYQHQQDRLLHLKTCNIEEATKFIHGIIILSFFLIPSECKAIKIAEVPLLHVSEYLQPKYSLISLSNFIVVSPEVIMSFANDFETFLMSDLSIYCLPYGIIFFIFSI